MHQPGANRDQRGARCALVNTTQPDAEAMS